MAANLRRRNDASEETRRRILMGALQQFAAGGIHGASLREISRSSDVPLSALHYYFGSKENLFLEVVEHFLSQLSLQRLQLLRECQEQNGAPLLGDIVRAFVRPLLELAGSPNGLDYVRLQLRPFEDAAIAEKIAERTAPTSEPFLAALERALPSVSRSRLVRMYRQMVWGVTHSLHDPMFERLTGTSALPDKRLFGALLDDLADFYAAGFSALPRDHD